MLADICVFLVVAFFIYTGYRAGFMRSFIKVASYLISIVLSIFLYPIVAETLMKTPIYDRLLEIVSGRYQRGSLTNIMDGNRFGVLTQYIDSGIDAATGGIASAITVLIVDIIAFVIILILSKIIIRIVGNLFGIFTKLPIIKQFNRLGGGIMGGVVGILLLYIVSAAMLLFFPINPESKVLYEIENSTFASEIYQNNLILNFIGKGK